MALLQSVSKLDTFRGNYEGITKKYVVNAILDLKTQAMIGSPSEKEFKETVSKNFTSLKSITVTCANITNSHTIFGPDLSGAQGKNCETESSEVRN